MSIYNQMHVLACKLKKIRNIQNRVFNLHDKKTKSSQLKPKREFLGRIAVGLKGKLTRA